MFDITTCFLKLFWPRERFLKCHGWVTCTETHTFAWLYFLVMSIYTAFKCVDQSNLTRSTFTYRQLFCECIFLMLTCILYVIFGILATVFLWTVDSSLTHRVEKSAHKVVETLVTTL